MATARLKPALAWQARAALAMDTINIRRPGAHPGGIPGPAEHRHAISTKGLLA